MKTRILLVCGGSVALLFGCATQPAESPQMLVKENAGKVENTADNVPKPPAPAPAPVKVASKSQAVDGEAMSCSVKGAPVMLDNTQVGITIRLGYCAPNLKPEGSKFWIPEAEVPALGNISVDDQCNITYCPTAPHYDHFGISDGKNTIQVQVKWQDNKPVIY